MRTPSPRPALSENLYWKRNKIYFVVSHNGQVRKGSTKTDDPKKAAAVRDREKAKLVLKLRSSSAASKAVFIPELLDDYLAHLQRKDDNKGQYKTSNARKTGYTVNKHV